MKKYRLPKQPQKRKHPVVDIERWIKEFPLSKFTTRGKMFTMSGEIISSPRNLALVEQIRMHLSSEVDFSSGVPVDIFLWGIGQPELPYLTKVGGVPHREKSKPWPTAKDGTALTFIVQFCFVDSRDIHADVALPGDVMLVYMKGHESFEAEDKQDLQIEWSKLKLQQSATQADCPQPGFFVPKYFGAIYRTFEFPDIFEELGAYEDLGQSYLIDTTQSTKIGSETHFVQGHPHFGMFRTDDGEYEGRQKVDDETLKHQFLLCTFNSFQPEKKWPYVNREKLPRNTTSPHDVFNRHEIMLYDVGCIYFLYDDRNQQVEAFFDCY